MGDLIVEVASGRIRLTLNRPSRGNALSEDLVERLLEALDSDEVASASVVELRGAGPHFCTGFDLGGLDEQDEGRIALRFVRIEILLQRVAHLSVETVGLAQGRAFGAGADLFCACQHRVAAPDATFRFPGLTFGVVLGTRRLASRVGGGPARDILLRRREVSAPAAQQIGLATLLAPQTNWDAAIQEIEASLAAVGIENWRAIARSLAVETRAADMADLVASVERAGFKERIVAYRDALRAAAASSR